MTANNETFDHLSSDSGPALHTALTVTSGIAVVGCLVALLTRLIFRLVIPIGWKCCLLCQDMACLSVSVGVVLTAAFVGGATQDMCRAGGFFAVFGMLDLISVHTLTALTFVLIQNPSKMSQLSAFRWGVFLSLVIPQKVVTFLLAALPVMPLDYFDSHSPFPVACFPIRQEGENGATFGAIFFFILWGVLVIGLSLYVVVAVRFWAGPGTRVHASSPSLWQTQKMEQGRSLHKFCLLEVALTTVMTFLLTIVVYSNSKHLSSPQWIVLLSLTAVVIVHVVLAMIQLCLWSGVCCDQTGKKREPHHRLKQLQMIRTEGPGKLLMKASWSAGKGMWRQGLLKVYGPAHIKAWAQEIVVLGLLRKSQSASVLQCLWTSNTNPYYETMTLISGDIVTSDSRLTCLELTSSGTLQELVKSMQVPLPETCQRTIMHDIAEGLSYLHSQNVLHRNLTSAAVYLKGSVQCLLLRAAIGDFEDAQIYGTLLTGSPTATVSRTQFFYPDIRAYALVGLEMLARVCECRQRERQPHRRTAVKVTHEHTKDKSKKSSHPEVKDGNKSDMTSPVLGHKNNLVKRYESPEMPYCAPGEAEYLVKSNEEKRSPRQDAGDLDRNISPDSMKMLGYMSDDILKNNDGLTPEDTALAEYSIDQNWKLQMRASGKKHCSDWRGKDWQEDREDVTDYEVHEDRYHHSQVPGITQVKEAKLFEFPNYSVFRAVDKNNGEDLDMVEEEIERAQLKNTAVRGGSYQQGGYITSRSEDGREIFLPATSQSSQANSSSGYGSAGGSTSIISDHQSSVNTFKGFHYSGIDSKQNNHKQVHKTTSAATISSFEDDILEVLPGVADIDGKPRRGEHLLKELLKARQDARVEQLIISYEERMKNGELGAKADDLPEGVVFPKGNRKPNNEQMPGENNVPHNATMPGEQQTQEKNELNTTSSAQKAKLSSPRAKSASSTWSQRLQQNTARPVTAASSRNLRSSLKRNKARAALSKALGDKSMHTVNLLPDRPLVRGRTAMDVEMKYGHRKITDKPPEDVTENKGVNQSNDANHKTDQMLGSQEQPPPQTTQQTSAIGKDTPVPSGANKSRPQSAKPASETNKPRIPVARKPSTKSRPAPAPPLSLPSSQPPNDLDQGKFSSFGGYDTSALHQNESFTSVEPASTESESVANCSSQSQGDSSAQAHAQNSVDKIESDMKSIIQSSSMAGAAQSQLPLPSGIRLIDSGFDSASVSSEEETCLCAAAALQGGEDGSCSCPSEMYSQGTCSCACSNCLGEVPRPNSWTGSQDSESWSNSNSFSSYDANMYRRKLPSKREKQLDSPGLVLAPDEQYPSPVHRNKARLAASALHPYSTYSPKRNRRRLAPTRGHYASTGSDTSSAASKRYRELIKKGVPLRVSVISGDDQDLGNPPIVGDPLQVEQSTMAAGDTIDNSHIDSANLYQDLESQGFFDNDADPRRYLGRSRPQGRDDEYQELSPIPSLEEIIKEIPDETGNYCEETKAFLNRPDSELSVKALQAVLSRHGSNTEGKGSHNTELIIDRIFTHHGPSENTTSSFGLQGTLTLDESAIREVAQLPSRDTDDSLPLEMAGLLAGMDVRHLKYCHSISTRLQLISMNELLPANAQSFDSLRTKLQLTGSVGSIGNQILELIRKCWLQEAPPTTAAIVDQLTDHVTETEL